MKVNIFATMFKVGDKVKFLNEVGRGHVIAHLANGKLKIACDDGFDYDVYPKVLVKDTGGQSYTVSNEAVAQKLREEMTDAERRRLSKPVKHTEFFAKGQETWEIDLHIEALVSDYRHMSNAEIIQTQVSRFKSFIYQANHRRIHRLIVIHGVGEGVLKYEIWQLLDKLSFPL